MIVPKAVFPIVFLLLVASPLAAQQPPTGPSQENKQALLGDWEWTLSMGPMKKKVSMEVTEKEGKLGCTVLLDDGTKLESRDFLLKDDRVLFSIKHEQAVRPISISHEGTLKGKRITGTAKMDGGPMAMSLKWDASKVKKK
jgi:hypothetical protein